MITFAFTLAFTLALILVFRRITINYAVEFIAASLEAFSAIVANFAGIKVAAIAFTTVIANFSVIKNTFFILHLSFSRLTHSCRSLFIKQRSQNPHHGKPTVRIV